MKSPYPQSEKLLTHKDERNHVVQFLEWLLDMEHVVLAKWEAHKHDDSCRQGGYVDCGMKKGEYYLMPIERTSKNRLAMRYLGIDENELEKERRAMLEVLRKANS